jgi:glycosyltransferase involved in cell wall biosynthesis
LIATKHEDVDRPVIVYVVVDNGANSRVKALGKLGGVGIEVVYVSSRDVKVAPLPNLIVKPWPNPFGVLRSIGLHRVKGLVDSVAYFPTRHRLYVAPVVNKLKRLIGQDLSAGKRVVVLTCAPPHTLCLVGQKLKAEYPEIRWIIDWQDLWSHDEVYFNGVFGPYRSRVRNLEHELVLQSDMNVTTNGFAKRAIEDLHGIAPSRVTVINHHFDALADPGFSYAAKPASNRAPVRIVFMGGMFKPPKVPGGKFLEALRKARENGVDVELHLYGRQSYSFEPFRTREAEFGFTYHGAIPGSQVLTELRKYDYQLLLLEDLPNSKLIMHLKLPEYLRAGVPIVAIVPTNSAVQDIVERTKTGHVIAADSDWAQGLAALVRDSVVLDRNEGEIARFDWRNVQADWRYALDLPEPVEQAPRENGRTISTERRKA